MSEMIELRNTSLIPKTVWEKKPDGATVKITLQGHEVRAVTEEVANLFLTQHPRFVVVFEANVIPEIPGDRQVWIANGTGNLFLPPRLTIPPMNDEDQPVEIANPLYLPLTLNFEWHPGQIIERDDEGKERAINQLPTPIVLRPYERRLVSSTIARWIATRDAMQPPFRQGKVRICRAPSEFEPNETWTLNDMVLYANMVDEGHFTAARLKEEFGSEVDYRDNTEKMYEAKARLFKYLFHRLVDDEFGLPSRDAFEARKKELAAKATERGAAAAGGKR